MIPSILANTSPAYITTKQLSNMHQITTHVHMPAEVQSKVETKEDHVTLSPKSHAQQLKDQGYSMDEIAILINRDIKAVFGYLR